MTHFEEHILEAYVLGTITPSQGRRVKTHLVTCKGCAKLVKEIQEYYADAEDRLHRFPIESTDSVLLPSRRRGSITKRPFLESDQLAVPHGGAVIGWMRTTRGRILAGAGTMVAAVVIGLMLFSREKPESDNPAYVHYNVAESKLEVYSKEHQLLWTLPAKDIASVQPGDINAGMQRVVVADIDGDRKNEIVMSVGLSSDTTERVYTLRALDDRGKIVWSKEFPIKTFTFRGTAYDAPFVFNYLRVLPGGNSGEIFALSENGRSPSVLSRFDDQGNLVGEYWHFGQLGALYLQDINGDGRQELVLCGQEDTGYPASLSTAVFIVLDPKRVNGRTQSSATRGFGWSDSEAEMFYIRIPANELNIALQTHSSVHHMEDIGSSQVRITLRMSSPEVIQLEYLFAPDMSLLGIKDNEVFIKSHDALRKRGLIRSTLSNDYYRNLGEQIQYWDGANWKNSVASVRRESMQQKKND